MTLYNRFEKRQKKFPITSLKSLSEEMENIYLGGITVRCKKQHSS